jgi:hypothetical protein
VGGGAAAQHRTPGSAAARQRSLCALALAVTLLAVLSAAYTLVTVSPLGCAFDDGRAYCRMAQGELAGQPFHRRFLVPGLVGILPDAFPLPQRFLAVSVSCFGGVLLGTFLLTARLARWTGLASDAARCAAVLATGLLALAPHSLRLSTFAPVLLDQASAAAGLAWVLLLTSERSTHRWCAALTGAPLVLIREAWAPVLLVAALVLAVRTRHRWEAAALALGAAAGTALGFVAPSSGERYPTVLAALHYARLSLFSPVETLWALLFALGLVPLLGLLMLRSARRPWPVLVVVAIGVAHAALAPVGGADVARIAYAAAPFLVPWAVVAALARAQAVALAVAAVVSVSLWRPFAVLSEATEQRYLDFYTAPASAGLELLGMGAAAVTVWAVARRRGPPARRP